MLFFLSAILTGYGQVAVGTSLSTGQYAPFNPFAKYSYAQTIYLGSEINAGGFITSIQWYYTGSGALTNSQDLTIYFAETGKSSFTSSADFVPLSELTQVYTGGITTGSTPGWKTITLTTPFAFDGGSNLVVAVDENMAEFDAFADKFRFSPVSTDRTIYVYADEMNIDPANPTNDPNELTVRGSGSFVPNIILGGIQQACPAPSLITANNATASEATINWTAATGQTDWEVYVVTAGSPAPSGATSGDQVTGTPTSLQSNLASETDYSVYVRSMCSETMGSGWTGPINFRTLCPPFGNFDENFDTTATGALPLCWIKTIESTSASANISVISYTVSSTPNTVLMSNSGDANAQVLFVTPALDAIGLDTHQLKFKARGGANNQVLIMGTMSDPKDPTTFVTLQTIALTNVYKDYLLTLNTSTTASHIAFKHGLGGTFRSIYIDDVKWEESPTTVPDCITEFMATPASGCGNFATAFTWTPVATASGYTISIATTPNGTDLGINDLDLSTALTYSYVGAPNTTYYYKIKAYNLNGTQDCWEDTFTTYEFGCYCGSLPTSNHGAGISNVQIGNANFPVTDVYHADFITGTALPLTRGVNNVMNIEFSTGSPYYTTIWIDYNNDFNFDVSEIAYTGQVMSNLIPSLLNTSFDIPLTAQLGEHRMRVLSTYANATPANPCYSGTYGVSLDFKVTILEAPTCFPPTMNTVSDITATSAKLEWISEAPSVNVEYGITGFTQGTGLVSSDVTAETVTLNNLTAQTSYVYYIQANCGSTNLSPWNGPYAFKTACSSFGDFTENFTVENTVPSVECWYTLKNSTSASAYVQISASSDYVQLSNSGDAAAALYLITPSLTALPLSTHRVKFTAKGSAGTSIMVGTMANPSVEGTFTNVQTLPLTTTFTEYSVSFTAATTNAHVAFKFVGTGTYQTVSIDDVIWEAIPSCLKPSAPTATNVTTTTATINWTASVPAPANGYDYFYTTDLALVPNVATTPSGTVGAGITTANLTNLATGAIHRLFVRSICNANDLSVWSNAGLLTTDCVTATLPYTINFENAVVPNLPTCTTGQVLGFGNSWATESLSNFGFNSKVLSFEWAFYDANAWFYTNKVTLVAGTTYSISYEYGNDDDLYTEKLKVAFGTTANAAAMTTEIANHSAINQGTLQSNIATFTPTASGEYVIGFQAYSDEFQSLLFVDNIVIQEALGSNGFENNSFTAYPNPVQDVLNLNYTTTISTVAVYNLLGQQVLSVNLNANKGQVNMSELAAGTYLVKVQAENEMKTFKVIKK